MHIPPANSHTSHQIHTMIVIRRASSGQVHALRNLSRSTFYETYADQNTDDDLRLHMQSTFGIEKLTSELENPSNAFFIAWDDEKMIGYAKLRINTSSVLHAERDAIELERMYVAKDFHGHQAGSALMRACCEYAVQNGFKVMWLGVWERNMSAIAFYEKQGFVKRGMQSFILGKDFQQDFVMSKAL